LGQNPIRRAHYTVQMTSPIQIALVSCPPNVARQLAETLIEQRVAACVNILPQVQSVYRWKDEITEDTESLLLIKFAAGDFTRLRDAVLKQHPYELPEIIAVNISDGHAPYLDWILAATRP
jgi:periplasmic divalent cation tolerance protein